MRKPPEVIRGHSKEQLLVAGAKLLLRNTLKRFFDVTATAGPSNFAAVAA